MELEFWGQKGDTTTGQIYTPMDDTHYICRAKLCMCVTHTHTDSDISIVIITKLYLDTDRSLSRNSNYWNDQQIHFPSFASRTLPFGRRSKPSSPSSDVWGLRFIFQEGEPLLEAPKINKHRFKSVLKSSHFGETRMRIFFSHEWIL